MYKTSYYQDGCTFLVYFSAFDKLIFLILTATSTNQLGGRKFSKDLEEERKTLVMVLLRKEHLESMIVDGLGFFLRIYKYSKFYIKNN